LLKLLGPSGRKRGLAEASWRFDDAKALSREFGQDGDEPRTCDQAPESGRHDLGRQEWQLSFAGQDARSKCEMARSRLDQWLPLRASVLPPFGGCQQWEKCTISVGEREALGIVGYEHPACNRRVLILSRPRVEPKQTDVIKNARSGFARIIEHPEKHTRSVPRAMADDDIHRDLQFGPFELSSRERVLRRDGVVLPLGGRALDLLIYLAERPGEVVAKQELIDHVWPDVTVEEGSIRVHVAAIRKALGDGQFGKRYIANIKGRGYSFIGSVAGFDDTANTTGQQSHAALPARPRRMIGRVSMLSEVRDNLREVRFVTLLGPGGIGKTTIAVAVGHAVAEEFGGEVYFVDLGSLADPDLVVRAIGTSLGLLLKSNEASLELVDLIRTRKLLIILDNCEHVIQAAASTAEQLFQGAGQVHLLATSRELLRVEGEHCYRVDPLDFPPTESEQTADAVLRYPAVQLFVRCVAARAGSFVLTDVEAPFVAEMCRKLDGIPLAIELAAGQVAALGIKNTVARLVSRLELLKLGHRTAAPRHRTLKATLDWSYDLLSETERIVFRRIAPFVGHFTLDGVRYVAGELGAGTGEIFDAVAGLVEKSLIATRIDETQAQYRLLDTTRAYALEKLEEHGEFDPISLRHAEYIIQQLESQKEALSALPRAGRAAAYSWQLSNVRSALEWSFGSHGNDEIATRLAVVSMQLFMELSLLIEWQGWAELAIARLEDQHQNSRHGVEVCASQPPGIDEH
jgi:predicted ATPase/DNA-binding winged helix-turn-helix (wHTH) protein